MRESDQIDKLAGALAKAQGQMERPERNKHVTVATKTGGKYTFKYAPLEELHRVYQKPLSDNGLSLVQRINPSGSGIALYTRLMHESGQWMESIMPIQAGGGPQAFGSELTYYRRYATASILNIVSEDDDDANLAEGNDAQPAPRPIPNPLDKLSRDLRLKISQPMTVAALEAAWKAEERGDRKLLYEGNQKLYGSVKEQYEERLRVLKDAEAKAAAAKKQEESGTAG